MEEKNMEETAVLENDTVIEMTEENVEAVENDPPAPPRENPLGKILSQVLRKGSTKELALIADNPDNSAEIMLVRGDTEIPETYFFHVDGRVMSPVLRDIVKAGTNLTDAAIDTTTDGIYTYMAQACGIAACFTANCPGVTCTGYMYGPLENALYKFIAENHGFSARRELNTKHNRNLSYRYRKTCESALQREKKQDVEKNIFFD